MNENLITPQKAFEIPILKILIELGGSAPTRTVYDHLEKEMNLTSGDLQTMHDGREIKWQNNAAWARARLVRNGEIDNSIRGVWRITEEGRKRYEAEGPLYKQSDYPPIPARAYRPRKKGKEKLVHPTVATPEFLQRWGVNQGLNLFELGLEDVRQKYWEHYHRKAEVDDAYLLKKVKSFVKEIRAFLRGASKVGLGDERLCFWVWFCYEFELYREGALVFRRIDRDSVSPESYNLIKKIGLACEQRAEGI